MLRQPSSKYAHGRSHSLLKVCAQGDKSRPRPTPSPSRLPGAELPLVRCLAQVKTFHDAEAIVIGHQDGKGRHAGRLGALELRMACGKTVWWRERAASLGAPTAAGLTMRHHRPLHLYSSSAALAFPTTSARTRRPLARLWLTSFRCEAGRGRGCKWTEAGCSVAPRWLTLRFAAGVHG